MMPKHYVLFIVIVVMLMVSQFSYSLWTLNRVSVYRLISNYLASRYPYGLTVATPKHPGDRIGYGVPWTGVVVVVACFLADMIFNRGDSGREKVIEFGCLMIIITALIIGHNFAVLVRRRQETSK